LFSKDTFPCRYLLPTFVLLVNIMVISGGVIKCVLYSFLFHFNFNYFILSLWHFFFTWEYTDYSLLYISPSR